MPLHYNAFISYRHATLDSQIAREIQRQLEHFHIPRAIAAQTGVKKINRIFRDKEELPITSDLNEDIAHALENSDYLIVICSPRTKASMWVQKEIETFLRSHHRSRVLTVLAEGEPGDVIPDILLNDTVIDEETHTEIVLPVEPLSCDYRLSRRKARREELPRLAATILGCGYDDLRQRQKLYRTRRLMAAMTATLVFTLGLAAYFVWSNGRIQANYQMALRNQGIYLASESRKALDKGDRILAAQLAMAAMPGEDNDRPAMPEVELALSRAVNAYNYEEANAGVLPLYSFSKGTKLLNFWLNDTNDLLAVIDEQSNVIVWDIETKGVLWQVRMNTTYIMDRMSRTSVSKSGVFALPDNRLLLWDDGLLTCYDFGTGDVLWTYQSATDSLGNLLLCFLTPQRDRLLALCYQDLLCLDTTLGTVMWTCDYPASMQDENQRLNGYDITPLSVDSFSPDGSVVAMAAQVSSGVHDQWNGVLLNLDDQSWTHLSGTYTSILDACMSDRDTVVILGYADQAKRAQHLYSFASTRKSDATLRCERRGTSAPVWETAITYYLAPIYETVRLCADNQIFCSIANVCCRVSLSDGEILQRGEMDALVVDYMLQGRDFMYAVLLNGSDGFFAFDDESVTCQPLFGSGVQKALCYGVKDSFGNILRQYAVLRTGEDAIQIYTTGLYYDDGYQSLGWDFQSPVVDVFPCAGSLIATTSSGLYAIDSESHTLKWQLQKGDFANRKEYYQLKPVGVISEQNQLIVQLGFGDFFGLIDAETGSLEELWLDSGSPAFTPYLIDNLLCWVEYDWKTQDDQTFYHWSLHRYDLNTGEQDSHWFYETPNFHESPAWACFGKYLLFQASDASYLINPAVPEFIAVNLQANLASTTALQGIEPYILAFADNTSIKLVDREGHVAQTMPLDVSVLSMTYLPEQKCLLALGINGQLYVYTLDGQRKAVIDLGFNSNLSLNSVRWQTDENHLILYLNSTIAYVINMETWKLEADIDCCFYVQDDLFLCQRSIGDSRWGAAFFTRYTSDELMEMGRDLIGELTLQEPEKYGLQ